MYQVYQQLKKSRVTDETVGDKAVADRLAAALMLQGRVVVHTSGGLVGL